MHSQSQLDKFEAAMVDGYNKCLGGLMNSMHCNSVDLLARNQCVNEAFLDSIAASTRPLSSFFTNGSSSDYINSVTAIDSLIGMLPNGLYPLHDARTSSGLLSAFNMEHNARLLAESCRMGVPMVNNMNFFPMGRPKHQQRCITTPSIDLERQGGLLSPSHLDISSLSNNVLQSVMKTSDTKRVKTVGRGRSVPLPEGTIRRIVLTLTTLVSQEIVKGYSEADESNTCIGQALKEFAANVILPSMLKSSTMSADKYKVTVVTLLLLREVMIQNSQIIFGVDGDIRDSNEHNEAEEEVDGNRPDCPRRIATKIIYAGIDSSTNNPSTSKRIREAFESVCAMYEKTNGKNIPLVLLEPADFKIAGITKGGRLPLKKSLSNRKRQEKVMAWKVRHYTKRKQYNRVA